MSANEFSDGPLTLDEQIKIVSLLENPPEAAMVRKALRFYEMPENLEYKWGQNVSLITVMKHYSFPQSEEEFKLVLELVGGKRSLLEIGSSFGGSLKRMAAVMKRGSTVVAVDKPGSDTPAFLNPEASLRETCRQLAMLGANVQLFLGDSHSQQVVDAVSDYGPFDVVFIDGDHSYDGMMADWRNYGPMGNIVAFHDISTLVECSRAWQEIKAEAEANGWRTEGIISADEKKRFGIGIVYRE